MLLGALSTTSLIRGKISISDSEVGLVINNPVQNFKQQDEGIIGSNLVVGAPGIISSSFNILGFQQVAYFSPLNIIEYFYS